MGLDLAAEQHLEHVEHGEPGGQELVAVPRQRARRSRRHASAPAAHIALSSDRGPPVRPTRTALAADVPRPVRRSSCIDPHRPRSRHDHRRPNPTVTASPLWTGAGLTAFAALLFPRINAVIYDHEKIWHLDSEAKVIAPLVVVVTLVLFAAVGLPLWRSTRLARASLVVGVVAVPRRGHVLDQPADRARRPRGDPRPRGAERPATADSRASTARIGIALGALAALAGAVMWLLNV